MMANPGGDAMLYVALAIASSVFVTVTCTMIVICFINCTYSQRKFNTSGYSQCIIVSHAGLQDTR